jgi:hypothetical protein
VHSALHGLTPKQITPETQNIFIVRQLRAQLDKRKTKACRSQDFKKRKKKETSI